MKPVKVGLCGLGTVGSGTFNLLQDNASDILQRVGRSIEVTHVGARRDNPLCDLSGVEISRDIFQVVRDPEIDIVVELIGGYDVAKSLVLEAIANGKHVVTANKALIAVHGAEIFAAAEKSGVNVYYEASVAGGIPIIKALRESLAGNKVEEVVGIINGTGNFILTEMAAKSRDFADVLKEAQDLGYAEADPTFDVEGIDAAHKLTILASIAFGIPLQFEKTYTEGISHISQDDVRYAHELGYRIKHLGIGRITDKGVELRVHPTLIADQQLISNVNGVMNAVLVKSNAAGDTLYYGAGAGSGPTASSVVSDIIDLARELSVANSHETVCRVPALGTLSSEAKDLPIVPMEEIETSYYLRLIAQDKAGVMAKIANILSLNEINIEAIVQPEPTNDETQVPIVLITHHIQESTMNAAIKEIQTLPEVESQIVKIRLENLA